MKLRDTFNNKDFVVTVEIPPPRGTNVRNALDIAKKIGGRIDGINVTDNQRGIMRMSPLAFSHLLKESGHEPIMQITCRDRNRLALQSDLLGAAALGIENLCVMTGDHPSLGDHPEAKAVFDLDSVQLIDMIGRLKRGESMNGKRLDGSPEFFLGGVLNPFVVPFELQLMKLKKKIEVGAEFFQTQPFFDIESLKEFLDRVKRVNGIKTKILIGVTPLRSVKMIQFFNEKVLTRSIPDNIISILESSDDPIREGIEMASEFIHKAKDMRVDGIHIMPIGA
ncbi:MAG: methylenetetrahydrofolate reductase, partial [Nitrospinae bacterium]|nr:methylenetetrahydrofolate reductase [Nitrospinota bacterium]